MTFINYAAREINCKIVYYGPGLGGKTTNLKWIYGRSNPTSRGKLISLATETDRTLFFDFLPLDLGTIRGFRTRFHLYTVPGQVFYDASRKLILKGVDGVVFVADSQAARMEANLESLRNLELNLKEQGYDLRIMPYVLQLNKRDLPSALPPAPPPPARASAGRAPPFPWPGACRADRGGRRRRARNTARPRPAASRRNTKGRGRPAPIRRPGPDGRRSATRAAPLRGARAPGMPAPGRDALRRS